MMFVVDISTICSKGRSLHYGRVVADVLHLRPAPGNLINAQIICPICGPNLIADLHMRWLMTSRHMCETCQRYAADAYCVIHVRGLSRVQRLPHATCEEDLMFVWCMDRVALLPCVLVIWSSAAFIASYIFAVLEGHVVPFVPYISDTGTCIPESGLFGFMISVTAMLGAATMYTRYKIIQTQNLRIPFVSYWFNLTSLLTGLLGSIGMVIVASFQNAKLRENSNKWTLVHELPDVHAPHILHIENSATAVHDVGALLTFVCGVAYIFLQSIISYKAYPQWNKKGTCCIRMTISVISIIALFPMIICASFDGMKLYSCEIGEEPSPYHQASAVCEWVVAFGFVTFFLTYIKDFQAVTLKISTEIHDDF